ncbi:MAG: bifunctional riboflavin kinase/FAD synthetase [Thiolinea sp.]
MKLLRHFSAHAGHSRPCVATIGNFDGLHLGHQHVLRHVREKAAELQLPSTVISFEPLPFEYFRPEQAARIYPLRDKFRRLNESGIEQFACLSFDSKLAQMMPEQFVEKILLDHLQVRYLVVGDDFRFGYQRQGDFDLLRSMGDKHGMQVVNLQTFACKENERVSSTRIRNHLRQGELEQANALLGTNYQLSGRIRHGDKLGRTINYPTLNLRMPENLALRNGVYAVKVHGLKTEPLAGVANLGTRPTVNGKETRLEVHLFAFQDQVYGRYVRVEPTHFIRAEQRFASFELLREQIGRDTVKAQQLNLNAARSA